MRNISLKIAYLWNLARDYITLGLLGALLGLSVAHYIKDLKLDIARADLAACGEGRMADRAQYEQAQAEYESNAIREKARIEQENRERAEQADQEYADLLQRYNASIVRYRANTSVGSASSGTNLSPPSGTSEGSNGPSTGSFILIPVTDAEICATNTARLQVVRDWVLSTHTEN